MRRWAAVALCAPLVLLAGCPQDNGGKGAATAKPPAQATAPAIAATPAPAPAAPTTQQSVEAAANAYKAQQLINQVESSYRSGVENYRAGRLEMARLDFDAAVDAMLTSGMDLQNDPQLADEFDHLLNAVNSLEMDALKQGNGLSPKIEEAPADAADEVTFPANPVLTAKVAAELTTTQSQSDLPLAINDYIAGFISYFSNNPKGHATLLHSLERAGKYKDMIQKIFRDEGVPQDLIYQAVAESGFQPQVMNGRSGAAGMWQFMPYTGAYGLERNGWFDERFDPEKATHAYARYMKTLHDQFGDWYLAMAAYDWGPGNVQRAVMRTGYADFWELYRLNALPKETKNYVPLIIAAIIMAKNPQQYGFDTVTPEPPVLSDTVQVDYAIDMRLVADVTDSTVQEIVALNPSLLRLSTPRDISFDLHLPVGTTDLYNKRVKSIPEDKRTSWRFHEVKDGETVESIAQAMRAKTAEVAQANDLKAGDKVAKGDELMIPIAAALAGTGQPERYMVRKGDTLVTVADRFGVSVKQLRAWNHLTSSVSSASSAFAKGRSLYVAEPVHLAPTALGRRMARTRKGARSTSSTKKKTSASKSSARVSSTKAKAASTKAKSKTSASKKKSAP